MDLRFIHVHIKGYEPARVRTFLEGNPDWDHIDHARSNYPRPGWDILIVGDEDQVMPHTVMPGVEFFPLTRYDVENIDQQIISLTRQRERHGYAF